MEDICFIKTFGTISADSLNSMKSNSYNNLQEEKASFRNHCTVVVHDSNYI